MLWAALICLGKVLVKGKRLPDDCHSDGEVSDEDEAADVEEGGKKKKEKSSKVVTCIVVLLSAEYYEVVFKNLFIYGKR